MLLKDRPVKFADGECSDTLYIRGLPKSESDESVTKLLSKVCQPVEIDLSFRPKSGEVWAKYVDVSTACQALRGLHHKSVNGSILSVKYELGLDVNGKRIVDRSSHTTIIRSVGPRKEGETQQASKKQKVSATCVVCRSSNGSVANCMCRNVRLSSGRSETNSTAPGVSYTSNSICVGDTEYPFPSGLYLSRVIELTNKFNTQTETSAANTSASNPLLALLTDTRSMGNKYAKEISETMAMVDAVQRAVSLLPPEFRAIATHATTPATGTASSAGAGIAPTSSTDPVFVSPAPEVVQNRVNVYVLGDGKRPLCAAAACLHLPGHFAFYSVDPLMMPAYGCAASVGENGAGDVSCTIHPNEHFGVYQNRFFPLARMSQDFIIPTATTITTTNATADGANAGTGPASSLSIVVSCHSHAPLQEFWERLQGPKIAVTMACCAEYAALYTTTTTASAMTNTTNTTVANSNMIIATTSPPLITSAAADDRAAQYAESNALSSKKSKKTTSLNSGNNYGTPLVPILEFEDFEVYSPKRCVKIYFAL